MRGLGRDGWPVRMALGLGVLGLLAIPGTRASWTDAVPVDGAGFSTGTVDLKVESADSVSGFTSLNMAKMEPGDSVAAVLTVTNSGTSPVSYYVDATTTGIGSQLAAKVTTDSTTNGSTCAGSALTGSGSFTAGVLSSSAPLPLAGGASQKLCIQAKLPDGGVAQGGSGTVDLTFKAITGSSAAPGWSDSVPVTGTSVGAAFAYYLGGNPGSNSTAPSGPLALRVNGPTIGTLYNYDIDRDGSPGLFLTRGMSQVWNLSAGSAGLTLTGTASLRIWSAVSGFSTTASGALIVNLRDCDSTGSTCGQLANVTYAPTGAWSGGSNTWVSKTIPITTTPGSYTWTANRILQIAISVPNGAGNSDMLVAYDTTAYKAALLIQ